MRFSSQFRKWFLRWLFPQNPPEELVILEEVFADIQELARGAYPREFVAFLDGTVRKVDGRSVAFVEGLSIVMYEANHYSTSFNMHDLPTLHGAVGTVHSHPSGSIRPSRADIGLFGRFGWCHLIIGSPYLPQTAQAYDKYGRPFPWRIEGTVEGKKK